MSPSEYQELTEFLIGAFERQRKETREAIEGVIEETRQMLGVSVEALRGEIRLVAEGVSVNRERTEENGRRIDTLSGRFDAVEHRIDDHEERLRKVE